MRGKQREVEKWEEWDLCQTPSHVKRLVPKLDLGTQVLSEVSLRRRGGPRVRCLVCALDCIEDPN